MFKKEIIKVEEYTGVNYPFRVSIIADVFNHKYTVNHVYFNDLVKSFNRELDSSISREQDFFIEAEVLVKDGHFYKGLFTAEKENNCFKTYLDTRFFNFDGEWKIKKDVEEFFNELSKKFNEYIFVHNKEVDELFSEISKMFYSPNTKGGE